MVQGIIQVSQQVWVSVIRLIIVVKIRLCLIVKWNRFDFLLVRLIVVQVMVIDCGEIILLVILLVVLVVISSMLDMLICCVVVVCNVENNVLDEVFELVRNIFSQFRNGEKNGNVLLVCVSVRVSVVDSFEQLVMKVNVSIMLIEQIGMCSLCMVLLKVCSVEWVGMCSVMMVIILVRMIEVLVVENQLNLQMVLQFSGVFMIGGIFCISWFRFGIGIFSIQFFSGLFVVNSDLNGLMFYSVIIVVRIRKGDYVLVIWLMLWCGVCSVCVVVLVLVLVLKWKICIGFQWCRNRVR